MRVEEISSISIFLHLQYILKQDVKMLQSKIESLLVNKNQRDLLDSLIVAKQEILTQLSLGKYEINSSIPSTPNKGHFTEYNLGELNQVDNEVQLLDLLLKIEGAQYEMVKSATISSGIPSELKNILNDVLKLYQKIVEQLGRSKSTQQLGTIVI